jgi:hypothetical protein
MAAPLFEESLAQSGFFRAPGEPGLDGRNVAVPSLGPGIPP